MGWCSRRSWCRCCCWRRRRSSGLLSSSDHEDNSVLAQNRAAVAIADVRRGCDVLKELVLPPGGAQVLSSLKENLRQLERMTGAAKAPMILPWARPSTEEQAIFENICPEGGTLLRTQTCLAAEGPHLEEYFVGRLFISDAGLLFEGCIGFIPKNRIFNTGLLYWDSVADMHIRRVDAYDTQARASDQMELVLSARGRTGNDSPSKLHLQLGFTADSEWIIEAWKLCIEMGMGARGILEIDSSTIPGETIVRPLSFHSVEEMSMNDISRNRSASLTSYLSASLHSSGLSHTASNSLSGFSETAYPTAIEPLYDDHLTELSYEALCEALESEDWPIDAFMVETLHAIEISTMPWSRGVRASGALVRRSRVVMPIPPDVPRALRLLLGAPESLLVTAVFQYRRDADEAVLVMHSVTHGLPYGDYFRIEDTIRLRPDSGGVHMQKWTAPAWVKPVPWALSILKGFLEKKVVSEAKAGNRILDRMFRELRPAV